MNEKVQIGANGCEQVRTGANTPITGANPPISCEHKSRTDAKTPVFPGQCLAQISNAVSPLSLAHSPLTHSSSSYSLILNGVIAFKEVSQGET